MFRTRLLLVGVALSLSGSFALAQAAVAPGRVIKAHFTAKDQQVRRYVEVPFDVPAGTTRVDIELKYDKAAGANVVDLGLYEPGSRELGTKAFRGWTGGERSAIFVSNADATPGYWPGPIQVGTWGVGLGLYKVGATGVDVEVTVRMSSAPEPAGPPALPVRSMEPARKGEAWYSGALHAHTWNSDGALPAQKLAETAKAAGLDFLAITDHNNTVHQRERIDVPGLLTIIGEEVTTPGGHMNVWGLGGWRDLIDFRVSPGDPAIGDLVKTATTRGALVGINHPYSECVACSWTHAVPAGVSTLEISGREPAEMLRAVALWDMLLREGRRVTAIGVSDWHRGDAPIGSASVRVRAAELSQRAIFEGIRAGRVVVMIDGRSKTPEARLRVEPKVAGGPALTAQIGDEVTVERDRAYRYEVSADDSVDAGATVELFWNGEKIGSASFVNGVAGFDRFVATNGYLRAMVLSASGSPIAAFNPIWIKVAAR